MNPEANVKNAIGIILSDKAKHATSLNWAIYYCKAALSMGGEELRTQCLYILNNITGWRHPRAKEVREVLKGFASQTDKVHNELQGL